MPMDTNQFVGVCNCDWLTLFGYAHEPVATRNGYECDRKAYGTRVFRYIDDVFYYGAHIATIVSVPATPILPPAACQIKISNEILYTADATERATHLVSAFDIEVKSVSRADVCVDFQCFKNRLAPAQFIADVFKGVFVCASRQHFASQGQMDRTISYQYLRLGSRSSAVVAYLYDKSQELEDVKNKPWIRDAWRAAGFREDRHTWRLEFSVLDTDLKLSTTDGEFVEFKNWRAFFDADFLRTAIALLYSKYWQFRTPTADSNKSRWPRVALIDVDGLVVRRVSRGTVGESSRSDRILIKKLASLPSSLRHCSAEDVDAIEHVITRVADDRDLQAYAREHYSRGALLRFK